MRHNIFWIPLLAYLAMAGGAGWVANNVTKNGTTLSAVTGGSTTVNYPN